MLKYILLQNQKQKRRTLPHHLQNTTTNFSCLRGKTNRTSGTKKVNIANGVKEKADCYISDRNGSIKMTMWGNFRMAKIYTFPMSEF